MGKRIDTETRAAMVGAYCEDDSATYNSVAKKFGVSFETARRIITNELQAVPGVKPDRRNNKKPSDGCATDKDLDATHDEVMRQKYPPSPRTSDWTEHVKVLNQRKREFEQKIEHKQAELDAARQEYRDFLATLEQLMKEEV